MQGAHGAPGHSGGGWASDPNADWGGSCGGRQTWTGPGTDLVGLGAGLQSARWWGCHLGPCWFWLGRPSPGRPGAPCRDNGPAAAPSACCGRGFQGPCTQVLDFPFFALKRTKKRKNPRSGKSFCRLQRQRQRVSPMMLCRQWGHVWCWSSQGSTHFLWNLWAQGMTRNSCKRK